MIVLNIRTNGGVRYCVWQDAVDVLQAADNAMLYSGVAPTAGEMETFCRLKEPDLTVRASHQSHNLGCGETQSGAAITVRDAWKRKRAFRNPGFPFLFLAHLWPPPFYSVRRTVIFLNSTISAHLWPPPQWSVRHWVLYQPLVSCSR